VLSPLIIILFSAGFLESSGTVRQRLIPLDVQISLSRAHELVSAGLFEQGREILLQLPEERRQPPYAVVHPVLSEDRPQEERTIRLESILDRILEDFFLRGSYREVMLTICQLRQSEEIRIALPWWRKAVYFMAHDVEIGPALTEDWMDELVREYPECREIASLYWMAIPPAIAEEIDAKRGRSFSTLEIGQLYGLAVNYPPIDFFNSEIAVPVRNDCLVGLDRMDQPQVPSLQSKLCESDMRMLEALLSNEPEDPNADTARFILGRYDEILVGRRPGQSAVLDLAYYEKGRKQFLARDFEGAIHTLQSFLYREEFAGHPWRDDARWRIAQSYAELGRYADAFAHLAQMEAEPDGYVPSYAEMRHSIFYLADVVTPLEDLERVAKLNLFPNIRPIILYTLAERQLVEHNYDGALEWFNEVITQYDHTPILPGETNTYGQLAREKIGVTQVLKDFYERKSPDYALQVADYLDTYDSFSPFENNLRFYIRLYYHGEPIPIDYLVKRSKTYLTATLREIYLSEHPEDPQRFDLYIKIAASYETIASWELLPTSRKFLDDVRSRAVEAYLRYIENHANADPATLDRAIERAGSLFLARCSGISWGDSNCLLRPGKPARNARGLPADRRNAARAPPGE
jgi:tetratricopeptide (TPR) repeat protein